MSAFQTAADYNAVGYVHFQGHKLQVTPHALERYVERVRPCLDAAAALIDLTRLIQTHATWCYRAPEWLQTEERVTDTYLLVGDDVLFPIYRSVILTSCITRGGQPKGRKEARRARRQKRAQVRALIRKDGGGAKVSEHKSRRGRPMRERSK